MASQITTINPATEETLNTYALMTNDEVKDAVRGCHEAFLEWRQRPIEERAETIRAIGNELANSKEDFAQLMTREVGKLIGDSRDEIDLCAQICQFTADNGRVQPFFLGEGH
ncbi:MAG TPA: aldehyde dehydrogenase, partial [Paracoccus sp.]|nr:aldehyde dehydrogenase [Paracoccus sp. (in: a-proteobacteria)]